MSRLIPAAIVALMGLAIYFGAIKPLADGLKTARTQRETTVRQMLDVH